MKVWKIIVADDEPDLVTLAATALKEEGYDVRTAPNGKEALRLARVDPPDLMVLDGLMPKMTGFDVSKSVKEEVCPGCGVKVLLMTAIYKKRQQKYEAMDRYGVDQVIYKPFDMDDFLSTVRVMLEGQ